MENKETDDIDSIEFLDKVAEGAANIISRLSFKEPLKPGHLYPSKATSEVVYDHSNSRSGNAVIFNQTVFKSELMRIGSEKDAKDLSEVLSNIGFDVKICNNFLVNEIKKELYELSKRDHSDNDCLFVCIMTHGKKDKKVYGYDGDFIVDDLWENFVGDKCPSLIGKPKLFFVQACRGTMTDPGVIYKCSIRLEESDAGQPRSSKVFVIPSLADLLVMKSTSEGYYAFRNESDGSWFIQALCAELRENIHEDLMTILTGVSRRVAYSKQSKVPSDKKLDASKQMPTITSMLTKKMYFVKKVLKTEVKIE